MIGSIFLLILLVSASEAQVYYSKVRNFSIELIYFTQARTNGHVVLAPFGVWSLMGPVVYAAEGDTRHQLLNTLNTNSKNADSFFNQLGNLTKTLEEPSDGVQLITKNYVFKHQGLDISPEFVTRARQLKGKVYTSNFNDINAPRLLNSIIRTTIQSPIQVFGLNDFNETELILSNVLMFNGNWSTPFNRSNTFRKEYVDLSGKPLGFFNMMSQEMRVPHSDINKLKATVTELPFGTDGKYCMLILKPYQGVTVVEVYKQLIFVTFKDIFDQLRNDFDDVGIKTVTVDLPRIEIQSFLVLNAPLNDMGIYNIFTPDRAQFLDLSPDELYVDTIEQRTKIFVSEEGVEAFATIPANLEIATRSISYKGPPFIFFIVDKSTMTIVMGGIHGRP